MAQCFFCEQYVQQPKVFGSHVQRDRQKAQRALRAQPAEHVQDFTLDVAIDLTQSMLFQTLDHERNGKVMG